VAIIVPMLLMSIASFTYASLSETVNTVADLASADYAIEITGCRVEYYNGLGYDLYYDTKQVSFNDSCIFPGWELIINVTIHNEPTSWICKLNYSISYWNETIGDWVVTDHNDLLNRFRLDYETGFYNATTGEPIVGDPLLLPDESVFKVEHLTFVASNDEFNKMMDETFSIKVDVMANYPDPIDSGG
jgi:hypothetical protein